MKALLLTSIDQIACQQQAMLQVYVASTGAQALLGNVAVTSYLPRLNRSNSASARMPPERRRLMSRVPVTQRARGPLLAKQASPLAWAFAAPHGAPSGSAPAPGATAACTGAAPANLLHSSTVESTVLGQRLRAAAERPMPLTLPRSRLSCGVRLRTQW